MSVKIAVVGSGQLAQMMARAGIPMGLQFCFLAEKAEDVTCVSGLGDVVVCEDHNDAQTLYRALGEPDIITVEKEHVDIALLVELNTLCTVHPNPSALEKFKNRRVEKQFLQSLNIPIAPFMSVQSLAQLEQAVNQLSSPVFLKSEEQGYDGYNQYKITANTLEKVKSELSFPSEWVAESYIDFEREVSFIAVRGSNGDVKFYPPVENYHRDGTLLTSVAPAPKISEALQSRAESYLTLILKTLDYVGVLCMECFECNGEILVNEIAPRVHNSGHWTTKGAPTSQFENHIRAVSGMPLGSTLTHGVSGMLNLLGVTVTANQVLADNVFLTLYGKAVRPRRKLGHVTVTGIDNESVMHQLESLRVLAYGE